MSLVRWTPARDLLGMEGGFERILEEFLGGARPGDGASLSALMPPVDVSETKDSWILKAELPGMRLEDVKITMTDDVLTVTGEKKGEDEEKDRTMHRIERCFGTFSRSFTLPASVQQEKIKARLSDGVLEIHVPKPEKVMPREIPIEAGR